MKKPPWLKKAHPDKPWKYKYTIQEGNDRGLVIEPYNFNTPVGMDTDKIEEACNWIDEQQNQPEITEDSVWQPKGHKTEWKVQTFNDEDVWLYRVDIPNPGRLWKVVTRETLIKYYRRIR